MNIQDKIKLFRISHEIIESELNKVESFHNIDLGRNKENDDEKDQEYYPQFDESVRKEAKTMGFYYELVYCLENSIRRLITDKMEAEHSSNWWEQKVPDVVKKTAEDNIKKEKDAGITLRSTEKIDYVNFGELKVIVDNNWDTFSDTFNSQRAFDKIMSILNTLRAPIAHCSPLADDEIVRLKLSVKDFFRLME